MCSTAAVVVLSTFVIGCTPARSHNEQAALAGSATVVSSLSYSATISPPRLPPGRTDDYAPDGGATSIVWALMGADNEGSFLSGIQAGELGDVHVVCNEGGQVDAAVIVLMAESASSVEANRFTTPDRSDFKLPVDDCVEIIYQDTQSACALPGCAAGGPRWLVIGQSGRALRPIIQSLQIDGFITPPAIAGTLHDWNPSDRSPQPSGYCQSGNSCHFDDNTIVVVTTVDASPATITGLHWLAQDHAEGLGPVKMLVNSGPGDVVLANLDGSSASSDQLQLPSLRNLTLPIGGSALLWHISNNGAWQLLASTGSTTPLFSTTTTSSLVATMINAPNAITPPALVSGARQDDWSPAGLASSLVVRATTTGSSAALISGLQAGAIGDWKVIVNFGPGSLDFIHASGGSLQPDQLSLPGATDVYTPVNGYALFRYDDNSSWQYMGGTSGRLIGAGDAPTANGCGTGATVVGADSAFELTTGDAPSGCRVNFSRPFARSPVCTVSSQSLGPVSYTLSASGVSFGAGTTESTTYDVICVGS